VDRGGPNVGGEEDKMKDKTICHKEGDEKKKSKNRTRRVMVREEMVGGGIKKREN